MIRLATLAATAALITASFAAAPAQAKTYANGISVNAYARNGISLNAYNRNGITLNAYARNGISVNAYARNGIVINGGAMEGQVLGIELPAAR